MRIDIITHCWSGVLDQYARLLDYQIASVANYWCGPRQIDPCLIVCYCPDDGPTAKVVERYKHACGLRPAPMRQDHLLNRAIGRNRFARASHADLVWYTDCDYVFSRECFDGLAPLAGQPGPLWFPRITQISRDHATGEKYIRSPDLLPIERADFVPKREDRAIGGIQIVPGDVARRGYCNVRRRQQPLAGAVMGGFRADVYFRLSLKTDGEPIDLPGLYRIRHIDNGEGKRAAGH